MYSICSKVDQMTIKFTNIFLCKTLRNLSNFFENIPSGNPDASPRKGGRNRQLTIIATPTA
jgi:hypothetical protein